MQKEYKWTTVRPILLQFDRLAYSKAASEALPSIGVSFSTFLRSPVRIQIDLVRLDVGPGCWRWYRL